MNHVSVEPIICSHHFFSPSSRRAEDVRGRHFGKLPECGASAPPWGSPMSLPPPARNLTRHALRLLHISHGARCWHPHFWQLVARQQGHPDTNSISVGTRLCSDMICMPQSTQSPSLQVGLRGLGQPKHSKAKNHYSPWLRFKAPSATAALGSKATQRRSHV